MAFVIALTLDIPFSNCAAVFKPKTPVAKRGAVSFVVKLLPILSVALPILEATPLTFPACVCNFSTALVAWLNLEVNPESTAERMASTL